MKPGQESLVEGIVKQLEGGVAPWVRPWKATGGSNMPHNLTTGKPYSGINVLSLWMASTSQGYETNQWATYKQIAESGGQVRKGEHGSPIWFIAQRQWNSKNKETGEKEAVKGLVWSQFTVFNRDQCDGLKPLESVAPSSTFNPVANAEAYFSAIGADVRHGGDGAFYCPSEDFIRLPKPERFVDSASYYATVAHEHIHWTGTEKRCDRAFGKRFGDAAYAYEELVAELGSAFLCAALGLDGKLQHPEYLGHWAKVLRAEPKTLWTVGSKASQAVSFLDALAHGGEAEAEGEEEASLSVAA